MGQCQTSYYVCDGSLQKKRNEKTNLSEKHMWNVPGLRDTVNSQTPEAPWSQSI